MVDINVKVDFERGAGGSLTGELFITNWDDQVKIESPGLLDCPIYVDRGDLLRAIAALEAGSV